MKDQTTFESEQQDKWTHGFRDEDEGKDLTANEFITERLNKLERMKEDRDKGVLFCIPFYPRYPRMSRICPGIVKGILYKVTANSGVGKTQFTKAMFCIQPLDFMRKNPEQVKVKIFYFALEESKEEFVDSLICFLLASRHNTRIDRMELNMMRENYPDSHIISLIRDIQPELDFYMNHIEVIDSVYNPTGLYKYCRHYSEQAGTHTWVPKTFKKKKADGTIVEIEEPVYSHYTPHDPKEHVIVITDHISLITEEYSKKIKGVLSKHQSMAKWSTDYCKKQITKHWNWTVVNVQQQDQASEKQQFTYRGQTIVEKTEPSLDGLANNKEIQRDDYVVMGLYSPDRIGLDQYKDFYDIIRFRDTYRSMKFLKNRIGVPNKYVSFLFDGATNRFKELPAPDEENAREKIRNAEAAADILLGRRQDEY